MTDKLAEGIKSVTRDVSKSKDIRGLHNFIADIRNYIFYRHLMLPHFLLYSIVFPFSFMIHSSMLIYKY